MTDALLGLGSNVGRRLENLRSAISRLAGLAEVGKRSSVYRSAPVGLVDQPDFLNAAVRIRTPATPDALLRSLLAIESEAGRIRTIRNAPRTLDIDILFFGDRELSSSDLTIPHPRWAERSFVLAPLAEIAPEWIDPATGRTVGEVWDERAEVLPPVFRCASLEPEESAS